jgi:hypothetical protein
MRLRRFHEKATFVEHSIYISMTEEEETQIQSKIPLIQNKSDTDFETDEAGSSSQSSLQSSAQSPHHRPFILNEKKERSWRKFFQILAKFLGPGFMVRF